MEILLIKQDTSEWDFMWLWLELHPINADIEDPRTAENDGEVWEYVGTYKNKDRVVHEFRHRNHPKTNTLYNASLNASDTFNDEQVESRKKIK